MIYTRKLDLQLFTEGGSAAGGGEGGESEADVQIGETLEDGTVVDANLASSMREDADMYPARKQQANAQGRRQSGEKGQQAEAGGEPTPEEWAEAKKRFAKFYGNDVQSAVKDRFKNQDDANKKLESMNPMIEALMKKTGAESVEELQNLILNDDSLYQEEADAMGMPVEQYKTFTMLRISKMYAHSELVPDIYKISATNEEEKAVANCMIAIELSQRMCVSAFTIMQNMTPIQGRPTFASKFIISRVNSCGRFKSLKFKYREKGNLGIVSYTIFEKTWTVNQKTNKGYYVSTPVTKTFDGTHVMDIECIAYTTAVDDPDNILESEPVSLRTAVEEGWYTKNNSKWQTIPRQMLVYRAASFWVSKNAPELMMGMKSTEETQDIVDIDYVDVTNQNAEKQQEHIVTVDTADFGGDKTVKHTVETESGEIIEVETGEIINNDNNPANPGF